MYSPGCDAAVGAGAGRAQISYSGLFIQPFQPMTAGVLACWCGTGVLPGARRVLHPGSGLGVHYVSAVDSAPFRGGAVVGLRHGKQSYGSRSSLHVADGYYLRVHRYRCIRSVAWPLQRPEVVFPHRAEASPTQGFRRSYGSYRLANDGVNPHPVPSGWGFSLCCPPYRLLCRRRRYPVP